MLGANSVRIPIPLSPETTGATEKIETDTCLRRTVTSRPQIIY